MPRGELVQGLPAAGNREALGDPEGMGGFEGRRERRPRPSPIASTAPAMRDFRAWTARRRRPAKDIANHFRLAFGEIHKGGPMLKAETAPEDWREDRLVALESALGPSNGAITHAAVPFQCGHGAGGRADVAHFYERVAGVVHATCELIGEEAQIVNSLGNYELAICGRADDDWTIGLIGVLAYHTFEERLEPGQTMDLGRAAPPGATVSALLFAEFGRFLVRGRRAGLLLCVGITAGELAACRNGGRQRVETGLRAAGVYPFTDLARPSVIVN
jgi:suppressor of fused protein SUFU